jgi:hypothetical protein
MASLLSRGVQAFHFSSLLVHHFLKFTLICSFLIVASFDLTA